MANKEHVVWSSDWRAHVMDKGEMKLRMHCGKFAPLKLTMVYGAETQRWQVLTQFMPEDAPPVLLSQEDLDGFPSDELIATAMLVSA